MSNKKPNGYWTEERLQEEALKFSSIEDFRKKNQSAYNLASRKRILDQICSHMKNLKCRMSNEELRLIALKYSVRNDFLKYNYNAYMIAHRRGILSEICSHMNYTNMQWTDELLQSEAIKYKTRSDFANGSRSAYFTAINKGILDKICSHMEEILHYWTDEELHQEALKYDTRGTFQYGSRIEYGIAWRRGILDKICSHMKKSCGVSIEEIELLDVILKHYPNTQSFRDMKVNIEGKPYIQGFEIDIFVPELNLGIEFDGTYIHSFEGLKRGRENRGWSEEDIRNYHELKDNWFLSKNIKVLHIKQEDWKLNKQACIQRCLDFLGGLNEQKVA